MPMRLPNNQPEEPYQAWLDVLGEAGHDAGHRVQARPLARRRPERVTAACNGLGRCAGFWKRGALLDTLIDGASLLLEMRTSTAPGAGGEVPL